MCKGKEHRTGSFVWWEISRFHLVGHVPHLVSDGTVDAICSDQDITREYLAILRDDFHTARKLGDLDNILASKHLLLVL